MDNRNNSSLEHIECVIGDLRDCVAEYRWRGVNTVSALQMIAEHWCISWRRVRTLFYRDQGITVTAEERRRLAPAAEALLHNIADDLEARADRCRRKADAIRAREQEQMQLPLGAGWNTSGTTSRRQAA